MQICDYTCKDHSTYKRCCQDLGNGFNGETMIQLRCRDELEEACVQNISILLWFLFSLESISTEKLFRAGIQLEHKDERSSPVCMKNESLSFFFSFYLETTFSSHEVDNYIVSIVDQISPTLWSRWRDKLKRGPLKRLQNKFSLFFS